jgi:uncharacterized delta-60 repeat protein
MIPRKIVRYIIAAVAATAALAGPAAAATPGSLDTSFGAGGYSTTLVGTFSAGVASAVQPNGQIVTAGAATLAGTNEMLITRVNSDGGRDTSFGTNGSVAIPIGKTAGADAITIQGNGSIVVAGMGRSPVTWTLSMAAARLTPQGQLDPTFGNGGIAIVPVGAAAIANGVVIQGDGKIVLGGMVTTDINHFAAARLTAGGVLDTTFGNGGVVTLPPNAAAWGVALQANGDIVLAGQEVYGGTQAFMAAELTPGGAPDSSFGNAGIVTVPIGSLAAGMAVAVQPSNGDILVSGNAYTGTPVGATVRLLPNGSLDQSFGSRGISTAAGWGINAMALQGNGDVLLAGSGPSAMRLLPDGTLDTSFGKRGLAFAPIGTKGSANGVAVQPDGMILLTSAAILSGWNVQVVSRLAG